MVSSVRSRSNHYAALGLPPTASDEEIAEAYAAFASRIRTSPRMHPREVVQRSREVLMAYETLRDPVKRRAYDASLRRQRPRSQAEPRVAPFIAANLRDPLKQAEHDNSANDEAAPELPQSPETRTEEGAAPFIAADAEGDYHARPDLSEQDIGATEIGSVTAESDARPIYRNRAGVAAGAVVVGLGVLTLLLGLVGGSFDRIPNTPRTAPAADEQRPLHPDESIRAAPPYAVPADKSAPQLARESASGSVGQKDAGANTVDVASTTSGAPAEVGPPNRAVPTQPATQPESPASAKPPEPVPAVPPVGGTQSSAATAQPVAGQVAGIPPLPVVDRTAPAQWLAGRLTNSDNPRGRFQGTVTVQFTVQTNGRATDCRTTTSSGNRALDARTCELVAERLRFTPALDPQGRPLVSQTSATYTWSRKHRPLLQALRNWIFPRQRRQ